MKVRIFRGTGLNVEWAVNRFIKDKEIVDIKYSTPINISGCSNNLNYDIYDSVLVIYKENEKID